jgi:ribosomal protein L29
MTFKLVAILLASLVVAFGAGMAVGTSGRASIERERSLANLRAEFSESRALVLESRISVRAGNFGDAIGRLQQARTLIGRVQTTLREMGQPAQAGQLEVAQSHLRDAHSAAARFDLGADASAAQALATLDAVKDGGR